MVTRMRAADLMAMTELSDWRVLCGRLYGRFVAPSFAAGAAFVVTVAAAADEADHHPDIDLRYPGVVQVMLTTHASHGLTDLDAALAARISSLATAAGLTAEPTAAIATELAIDALDIDAVRPFWQAVLGFRPGYTPPGEQVVEVVDARRFTPPVWFQRMDAPRPQRNRLHLDVTVAPDVVEERIAAALAAGGRLLSDAAAPAFWVLADPEGNEACLCTWQGRD